MSLQGLSRSICLSNPDIDFEHLDVAQINRSEADCAIRYTTGPYPLKNYPVLKTLWSRNKYKL